MALGANKDKPTHEDYEKLGRAIEGALIDDYIELLGNTRRQIKTAFIRGIFAGFGGVIGATVVVAIVVWAMHMLGGLPVIGEYLQGAGNAISQ